MRLFICQKISFASYQYSNLSTCRKIPPIRKTRSTIHMPLSSLLLIVIAMMFSTSSSTFCFFRIFFVYVYTVWHYNLSYNFAKSIRTRATHLKTSNKEQNKKKTEEKNCVSHKNWRRIHTQNRIAQTKTKKKHFAWSKAKKEHSNFVLVSVLLAWNNAWITKKKTQNEIFGCSILSFTCLESLFLLWFYCNAEN